ncbi:hypothetical protein A2Z33_02760 [Candidatus Gottesmanbacteria bacterium RBG_16_52_11]|uniref:Iron transporter n=1 Tax=Candidatus Gottesmanbacteria bacterium RBG_16_52_11 TaxID=1798374 RepID=A0A1F5YMM0_9BACT|nr:MAG: hypothetical protein A2Z33_02760 [Candidatus Gottesmanbacteria bacterium RBG_16_52_11]
MKHRVHSKTKEFLPGLISGAADNDPSGISTFSVAGIRFGYQQLWIPIIATPMLISVQAMSARLGDLKRQGLMSIIRSHYPPWVGILAGSIIVVTSIATLGADLSAIAEAAAVFIPVPYYLLAIIAALSAWYIMVFRSYRIVEKYLSLLTVVFVCYVIAAFLAKPDWLAVLGSALIPSVTFSKDYFIMALGLMGTTITPPLFFWQSKQEIEEKIPPSELKREAKHEDMHVAPGFILSNLITFFVMVSTATVFHRRGIIQIESATQAAIALEPLAGSGSMILFAVGIIGAGLLAVPVFAASAAYTVSEMFGWKDSLSDPVRKAKAFYAVLTAVIIMGFIFSVSGIRPLHALLYSQVLNGMLAPFLIFILLKLCNDSNVVGNLKNRFFDNFFGALTLVVMAVSTAVLIYFLVAGRAM